MSDDGDDSDGDADGDTRPPSPPARDALGAAVVVDFEPLAEARSVTVGAPEGVILDPIVTDGVADVAGVSGSVGITIRPVSTANAITPKLEAIAASARARPTRRATRLAGFCLVARIRSRSGNQIFVKETSGVAGSSASSASRRRSSATCMRQSGQALRCSASRTRLAGSSVPST
jgi:hypothetical protein